MSWQILDNSAVLQPGTRYFIVDVRTYIKKGASLSQEDTGPALEFLRVFDENAATRAAGGVPMNDNLPKDAVFRDTDDITGNQIERKISMNGSFYVHPASPPGTSRTAMEAVMRGILGDPNAGKVIAKKGYGRGRRKTRRNKKSQTKKRSPPRSRRTK